MTIILLQLTERSATTTNIKRHWEFIVSVYYFSLCTFSTRKT